MQRRPPARASRLFVLFLGVATFVACGGSGGGAGSPEESSDIVAIDGFGPHAELPGLLSVRIVAPEPGAVLEPDVVVTLVAEVRHDGGRLQDVEATWTSSRDGELGRVRPNAAGNAVLADVTLSAGEHTLRVMARPDGDARSTWDEIGVVVRGRPSAPEVLLQPAEPLTDDDLLAVLARPSIVPGGGEVTYAYRWLRDGATVVGQVADVLPASVTRKGETWQVAVTPSAAGHEGAIATATVMIGNTPPALGDVAIFPTVATTDSALHCSATGPTDADGDLVTLGYAWELDGAPIAGATSDTLPADATARGDQVRCIVTPGDGEAEGTPVASPIVAIGNSPPWVDSASIAPASGDAMTEFVCVGEGLHDPDADEVALAYTWYADGDLQLGVVTDRFPGGVLRRGQRLVCAVTPSDGATSGTEVRSREVAIGNTAPTLETVLVTPPTVTARDTLACVPQDGHDLDGDPIGYGFAWFVNGTLLEGSPADHLSGAFRKGDTIECEATPTDGLASGAPVRSKNAAAVRNAPPTLTAVVVSPPEGRVSTVFRCEAGGYADPDTEDPQAVRLQWYRNGVVVPGAITDEFTGELLPGDELTCSATPYDGESEGTPVVSDAARVTDTAPRLTGATLLPTEPTRASLLECTPEGWSDPEGAPPTYRFAWIVNGRPLADAGGDTLDAERLRRGDVVLCQVTPYDGYQEGPAVTSNAVTVQNGTPQLATVQLIPGFGNHNTVFACTPSDATDADGDTLSYVYAWYFRGALLPGVATPTYRRTSYDTGDRLQCEATPSDGLASGPAIRSNEATLFNAVPTLEAVVIGPSPAYAFDAVTCAPQGFVDGDGDEPRYVYRWYVNGVEVDGQVESSLPPGAFVKHDEVVCQVTPGDGYQQGPPRNSPGLRIENSLPTLERVTLRGEEIAAALWLRCAASGAADADGDPVTLRYRWLRNDEPVPGATGELLQAAGLTVEDVVTCEVTPNDGDADGAPVRSNDVDMDNSPPVADITKPSNLEIGLQTYIRFEGLVSDEEDPPELLRVTWTLDGTEVVDTTPPTPDGTVGFSTNELPQGIHRVQLSVKDSLLATGSDLVVLVIRSECGTTGYVLGDVGMYWSDGFESGDLTSWEFSNRKFVGSGTFPFMMSSCDNPFEFLIDPTAARSGELGLVIDLPSDYYTLAKRFGTTPISSIYVECWVYPIDRVNIQFGLFYEEPGGTATQPGPMTSAGALLLTTDTGYTYVPAAGSGESPHSDPNGHYLAPNEWSRVSLFRDVTGHQLLFYENFDGREIVNASIAADRPPTGFAIGMNGAMGGGVMGYVDDCQYLIVEP